MLTVKGKLITHKTGKYFSFSHRQRNQNSAINTYPTTAFDIFTTSYKLFFEQDDIDKNRIALSIRQMESNCHINKKPAYGD